MSAQVPASGARTAPSARTRSAAQWLSSEWGLAALALVLAVLVWAVVWGNISSELTLDVRIDPRTSPRFVAFHEGTVRLTLRGPRGEIDEASQRLGAQARVAVTLDDPPPDRKDPRVPILSPDQYAFPFSRRLVASVTPTAVEVYRWAEAQVRFLEPELKDVPAGIRGVVTLVPATAVVEGPAGKVGETIRPDPVSVGRLFAEPDGRVAPGPIEVDLAFEGWRSEPAERRYRGNVRLPAVRARIEFEPSGKREIRNRIEFRVPRGYVVTPSGADQDVELGYYKGRFEGTEKDLATLERSMDSWWYVVRIPPEKLPADAGIDLDEYLPIEYVATQALHPLRVRFAAGATLLVTIRRSP